MRIKNKKSLIALLAAALLLISTVGVAVAYFSAMDQAAGDAKISLTGKTEIHEGDDKKEKNVTIQNVGETDVVVRVKAFGPAQMVTDIDSSVWVYSESDGYYYYKGILTPKATAPDTSETAAGTFNVKLEVSDKEKAELGDNFTITVIQECAVVYDKASSTISPAWQLPFSLSDL